MIEKKHGDVAFLNNNNILPCRIFITIPILYRENRFIYFFEQIRCIAEFKVEYILIKIITNASDEQIKNIESILDFFKSEKLEYTIEKFWIEDDPKALTWQHKKFIPDDFLCGVRNFTHFVYLEDDIRFSFSNFCYFVKYRTKLQKFNLIPSYSRYELNHILHDIYMTDLIYKTPVSGFGTIFIEDERFVTPSNPYCAMFVLDHALAEEYIVSDSFDRQGSQLKSVWKAAERAAAGLCFENVPIGFGSRFVVKVDLKRNTFDRDAIIHHQPNNYTDRSFPAWYPRFGKMRYWDTLASPSESCSKSICDPHNGAGLARWTP